MDGNEAKVIRSKDDEAKMKTRSEFLQDFHLPEALENDQFGT